MIIETFSEDALLGGVTLTDGVEKFKLRTPPVQKRGGGGGILAWHAVGCR